MNPRWPQSQEGPAECAKRLIMNDPRPFKLTHCRPAKLPLLHPKRHEIFNLLIRSFQAHLFMRACYYVYHYQTHNYH